MRCPPPPALQLSPDCGERLGLAVTVPLAVAVYDLLTYSQLPVSNSVTLVSAMGMIAFLFSMVGCTARFCRIAGAAAELCQPAARARACAYA